MTAFFRTLTGHSFMILLSGLFSSTFVSIFCWFWYRKTFKPIRYFPTCNAMAFYFCSRCTFQKKKLCSMPPSPFLRRLDALPTEVWLLIFAILLTLDPEARSSQLSAVELFKMNARSLIISHSITPVRISWVYPCLTISIRLEHE